MLPSATPTGPARISGERTSPVEYDRRVQTVFHAGAIAISGDALPETGSFGMVPTQGSPFR
jgi:hypothetical protein